MKTCSICGTKNFDVDKFCTRCKNPLDDDLVVKTVVDKTDNNVVYKVVSKRSELSGVAIAAKVFWIISLVYTAIVAVSYLAFWFVSIIASAFDGMGMACIFAIAALVPFLVAMLVFVFKFSMYRHYIDKKIEGKSVGIGFKIVVLLFIDLIAGVLLFCDE